MSSHNWREETFSRIMAFNYVVTAQKPTNITSAICCHFTGSDVTNLILCKSTKIDILNVTASGLEVFREIPLYGRIALIKVSTYVI